MLKAHNTKLKHDLRMLKVRLRYTELIIGIEAASFRERFLFAYKLVLKKL